MLTILVLAAALTAIFAAATYSYWRRGNRLSGTISAVLTIILVLATWDIAIRLNTASPLDLIRQPVPPYLQALLGSG
jgi:hypothetical protein